MFARIILDDMIAKCFTGKAIILYWPRQVGKTTLTLQLQEQFLGKKISVWNGDDSETQSLFQPSFKVLQRLVHGYDIIILDEAQRIKNIGLVLKLLVDNFPEKQVIATGSSSFDLSNSINEPLTWRSYIYHLYPLSLWEIYTQPLTKVLLEERMIFGSYPDVVIPKQSSASEYLKHLVDHYLYKDLLGYAGIKKYDLILKLLQALALQIGNEFSYVELANTVGADKDTVQKYINIFEQAFIITTLAPLHTNQRRVIKSHKKIYFRDLWVRNALLNNFNPLALRGDVGALRENLCFIERTKYLSYHHILHNQYFWRDYNAWEIDYIEQYGDHYDCYEFKYSEKKWASLPKSFAWDYPSNSFTVIRNDTLDEFLES